MPNHKSCKKRMKTSAAERERNRAYRSRLRKALKEVRSERNKEKAEELLKGATSLLDHAASIGLIHRRNAARNKSRLAHYVQKLS